MQAGGSPPPGDSGIQAPSITPSSESPRLQDVAGWGGVGGKRVERPHHLLQRTNLGDTHHLYLHLKDEN